MTPQEINELEEKYGSFEFSPAVSKNGYENLKSFLSQILERHQSEWKKKFSEYKAAHEKKCTLCEIIKPFEMFSPDNRKSTGRKSQCRDCDNIRSRKSYYEQRERRLYRERDRNKQRERDPLYLLKLRARGKIKHELKMGRMTKQPCEVCGELKVQAHHTDYNKPLEVRWLCVLHHRRSHLRLKVDRIALLKE